MSSTVRLVTTSSPDPTEPTVAVDVDLANGGRLAQITVSDLPLLTDVPDSLNPDVDTFGWGSYPMAPWAGRLRGGRFRWFNADHRLRLNHDDSGVGAADHQHAMHGTVLDAAWIIDEQTESTVTISCPLDQPDSGWTLGGVAHQRIEVFDRQLRCDLSVTVSAHSDHALPFPAEIGWHPWWRKPDSLSFHPDAMYERDTVGLPTGQLVAPSAPPWDDCFVNTAPVTLHYDRPLVPNVTLSSDCDHWVVYDHPRRATCVEPQSGPPNAFNMRSQIVTATRPLRRTMTVGW
jgi:aldose 1-epimerase